MLSLETPFERLADVCERLEHISSRTSMVEIVAEFLRKLDRKEVKPAVRLMLGKPLPSWDQRTLDVNFKTLIELTQKITGASHRHFLDAFNKTGDVGSTVKILFEHLPLKKQKSLDQEPLTIASVYQHFENIADATGSGSRIKKKTMIETLLSRASPLEVKYIIKNFGGEMRYGFRGGLMEEAIGTAYGVPVDVVRRANMLISDLGSVAEIAKNKGEKGLQRVTIKLFHPIKPMLAEAANDIMEVLDQHDGRTSLEYKPDGARVQIHRQGDKVRIFSRHLSDVTKSLPDVVELVRGELKANAAVVEGEVIAVASDGRPRPFQYLMRRFRRVRGVKEKLSEFPVTLQLFDVLYIDGACLVDVPYVMRRRKLSEIAGRIPLTKEIVTSDPTEGQKFLNQALADGYEGLVAKEFNSYYTPGIRGKKWLKIKRFFDTLDLVIVAADFGYGYRHAWLSNYHLAARNPETGELEVVGKCFTGFTDEEIQEMTRRLKSHMIAKCGRTVIVQPKIVLEVAFSEIQKSPHYKSGFALRFARILRVREDKTPEEADTTQKIGKIYERQFEVKAR